MPDHPAGFSYPSSTYPPTQTIKSCPGHKNVVGDDAEILADLQLKAASQCPDQKEKRMARHNLLWVNPVTFSF